MIFKCEEERDEVGGGDLEEWEQVSLLEDLEGYGGERSVVGKLCDLKHVDAPDSDVVQALAQLLLLLRAAGHHSVLGHLLAGDGVEAVGVGQGLVADPPDGAHHLPSSIRLIKVSLTARVLKVNLLIFVWSKIFFFKNTSQYPRLHSLNVENLPRNVLQMYSEIWFPDLDSENKLSSLLSIRLN